MNFERIYEIAVLRETISKLEGKPRKSVSEDRFLRWLQELDNTQKKEVIHALKSVHLYGQYGTGSHEEQGKPGLFGISVRRTALRIYFTEVDDKYIRLEGGSSTKNGAGHNSEQDREIKTIWKIVQARRIT
jgi:hypothetical protein